jgi:hypothetical protein
MVGICLASVIRPEGSAPKGQESLAQGSPWVSQNKRFALTRRYSVLWPMSKLPTLYGRSIHAIVLVASRSRA